MTFRYLYGTSRRQGNGIMYSLRLAEKHRRKPWVELNDRHPVLALAPLAVGAVVGALFAHFVL